VFLTIDVVSKVSTVVKDSHNRSVSGFKAVINSEILNLQFLSFAREFHIEEKFPKNEMYGPNETTDIDSKELCLLTFNFGSVTSEKVIVCSFKSLKILLESYSNSK
jgi:hypothetical protein